MPIISVHNADYLRTSVTTHKQKVLSLYKRAVRDLESWEKPDIPSYRYKSALLRARFDENKGEIDMRKAKLTLQAGEAELWEKCHWKPMKFNYSPGGICYERYYDFPDWHLDYWHPLEKAQYPHYFAKREERKIEFIQLWEARYGQPAQVAAGTVEHGNYQDEPATDDQKKYGPFTTAVPGAPAHH